MASVLITGANRGIGLELTRQLQQRGDKVVAVCREASQELQQLPIKLITGIDVSKQECVSLLASQLDGEKIDVLINNAGVLTNETLGNMDFANIQKQMEVNAYGPLRVVCALQNHLVSGSKVILISSRMGSIDDNSSGGMYGYRMSKAALNMAGVSLARDLQPRNIIVALLHPGMVATEMTGNSGIAPSEAASGIIARLDEVTLESSGQFFHANGELLPW